MNTYKSLATVLISMVFYFSVSINTFAQTAGSLTFSCSTDAPSGSWGTRHVLAIWIEDTQNPSNFVKTKAKYGHDDDHLTEWVAKSNENLVDATTGATLTSYNTRSVIWDGTDVSSNVVADGTYKIFIEMGWGRDKTNQHSVMSFQFIKGAEMVQLTPTGNSNYTDVVVNWTPTVTLVNQIKNNEGISVFPNPSKGIVNLDFKNPMQSAKVTVENESGAIIYSTNLENDFTGNLNLDLNDYAKGIYFVKVTTKENKFIYKLLLTR